ERALAVLGGEADERLSVATLLGEAGEHVVRRFELERDRVTPALLELALVRCRGPEVRHGRGHQQHVAAGELTLARVLQLRRRAPPRGLPYRPRAGARAPRGAPRPPRPWRRGARCRAPRCALLARAASAGSSAPRGARTCGCSSRAPPPAGRWRRARSCTGG